ncbi:hypothetical protein NDU88_002423 [Pleurodeles waltl]|uniref:Uncharacterized protein n=1 Tax=Pleurodeles waltl TaxID=8319 RepID=A0AAV7R9Y3_PLEWA|nr:hypothetical protein NDU88_002423 [Pleurodeles waltl]
MEELPLRSSPIWPYTGAVPGPLSTGGCGSQPRPRPHSRCTSLPGAAGPQCPQGSPLLRPPDTPTTMKRGSVPLQHSRLRPKRSHLEELSFQAAIFLRGETTPQHPKS